MRLNGSEIWKPQVADENSQTAGLAAANRVANGSTHQRGILSAALAFPSLGLAGPRKPNAVADKPGQAFALNLGSLANGWQIRGVPTAEESDKLRLLAMANQLANRNTSKAADA